VGALEEEVGASVRGLRDSLYAGLVLALGVLAVSAAGSAMTMREAVVMAVETNPDIGEAVANREAREFELRQGRGLYLPSIDVEGRVGGYLRDSPTTRATGDDDDFLVDRQVSVIMRQLLFDGFGVDSEVDHQASRVDGASFRVMERSEFIALAVIREYLDILRLSTIVAITRENVGYHERLLERIRLGIVGGTLSIADREQAEERLFAARARVDEAREELSAAQTRFIRLVGKDVGRVTAPASITGFLPASLSEAIAVARRTNPTIKAAQADVDAAYSLVKAVESRFYPRLALEGRARTGADLDGIRGRDSELRAGVVLEWNLYRGGIDLADRQEQIRRTDEATMRLHRISREVDEAVRLAWDRRHFQRQRLAFLTEQAAAVGQLVKSYAEQFIIGQRSLLDLLDTQNTLLNTQITVETAATAVLLAEYRILAACGILLRTLGVAPPPQATPYARDQADVPPTPPSHELPRVPPPAPPATLGPLY
jgi:outer membrane protein, adhesin transport system